MRKRIIALLLALILTVGLLPTVALAAEGDGETSSTNAEVVIGKYNDKDQWEPGTPTSTLPDGVKTVSKTAKPTTNANEYEVTLQVVLQQTEENSGKAETVLVLDTSGSMAYCAECGAEPEEDCVHNYVKFDRTPNSSTRYYYETKGEKVERAYYCDGKHWVRPEHSAGWFTTSGDSIVHNPQKDSLAGQTIYVKSTTPRTSRLDAAKVAAENFLKTYSGLTFKADGTVAANQNSRNLGRYVSVVSFATGAALEQEWVDVSNANNYQTVLNKIKALKADGGTNLDAGLTYAEYLLKKTTVNDAVKNVIALTDGQPTFFIDTNEDAYDDDGLTYSNKEFLTIDRTKYRVHGTGDSCNAKTFTETVASAVAVKNHAKLYTVCFDADEKIGVPDSENQISVSEYLSTKIATQPTKTGEQFAYDASNAEQLYAEFAKITQSIVSGLNTGTVRDTLPAGITSEAFGKDKVKEWKLNEAPFTKNETPNTVGGKQVTTYTYTYTYTVTIDPEKASLVEVGDENYAPLNGETTLTVKNSAGENVTIHFPIPAGKVTMPSYTVTYTDGVDSEVVFENVEKTAAYKAAIPAYGDSNPTRTGYTFTSWKWYNATDTTYANEITPAPTTMPANNLVAVAQWTPATDTKYIVEHYLQNLTGDGYAKQETETKAGTTGATATAEAKTYTGFMFDENNASNVKSGTIAADGSLVLKLYYTRNKRNITYTYTDTSTVPEGAPDLPAAEANVPFGAPKNVAAVPTLAGYTFTGWTLKSPTSLTIADNGTFTMPDSDVVFEGSWTKNGDAGYKIEYYLETLATGTFERDDTLTSDEKSGTIGTTAEVEEADKKPITGFTFDANNTNNKLEGEIVSGDPLTLKLYYKRNSYKVTYQYTGTVTPEDATKLPDEATYKYGAEVIVAAAATSADYIFSGWSKTGKFNMPAEDVTITGSWTQATYDVNLLPYVKKTLEVDGTLPTGFSETFKVDVTVDGQRLQQKGTVTMTAAGTSSFNMPTVALTEGTHTIMVQEVVDEQTKNSNIAYDTNQKTFVLNIPTSGAAAPVQYGTTDAEGNFVEVKEPAFVTITNTYTEPKAPRVVSKTVVTNLSTLSIPMQNGIHEFESRKGTTILYPVANNGTNTLEVTKGTTTARLLYKISVDAGTQQSLWFDDANVDAFWYKVDEVAVSRAGSRFKVEFKNNNVRTADIYVTVNHTLNFNKKGECTVENAIGEIKATTTVTEKDPSKLYIDFSDFVQKELTATGSKTASDVNFTVNVKESPIHVINSTQGEEAVSTYAGELLSTTLNAHFDSITGGETKTEQFTGSIEIKNAGVYRFELTEVDGQRTGVTYDETVYKLNVTVEEKEGKLVVSSYSIIKDGYFVSDETITFHNTIDTGRDDYIPIIIPTIINKDTGMLNKTDHFAYVIGYPDGTVHPNGQITRAEVATIFFRLLRDEVRDGAFTTSNTYSDVAYGKWYNNPISTMSALGIITGYPDGTFKPNKPITRAEFAAIAARFDETQSGKSATFSDVIGHWAAKEIGIAYYNDWIKGYPDGTFKPDQNITRAEAMTLINRVLERKPESPADLLTNMNKWTDNMDTSKWYYLDVQEATNSHGYTRKTFNYELWRQMLPDPDWSRYER